MKAHFFWIALGLIGVSWILNSIYAYSKYLDEPVFLNHYIDVVYQEDFFYMTFYYLTNKNDTSFVSSVSTGKFTGYPEVHPFSHEQVQNKQLFNNHVLRSVNVMFDTYQVEQFSSTEDYSFTEMDVVFTNGKKITAPIGIVNIRSYFNERSPFEQVSSGSDGYRYRATEPLTVETIKSSFQETLQDNLLIKIDQPNNHSVPEPIDEESLNPLQIEWQRLPGLDLKNVQLPFDLEERETLNVFSSVVTNFKAVLDLNIYISGTTESGKAFSTAAGLIIQPYLEQKDVNQIIKEKTKGDTDE